MTVRWRENAKLDLLEIAKHIAQDNPAAARRLARAIREHAATLAKQPLIGRSGRLEGIRELVIPRYPYVVPYLVKSRAVEILAVIHAARLWPLEF